MRHLCSALAIAGLAARAAPALRAQEFEVASVKPAVAMPPAAGNVSGRVGGGGCIQKLRIDRGRVDIECATVVTLIGYAFRFSPERITGPDWTMGVGSPKFDIAAKLPQGASEKQVPEMVQALLAARFKLAIHRGTTRLATYALVVAKGGLKVKEAAPAGATDPDRVPSTTGFFGAIETGTVSNANGSGETATFRNPHMGTVRETEGPNRTQRWEAPSITFEGLADLLDKVAPLAWPVIDMTGLKGRYRVVLEVSLNDQPGENGRTDMEEAILRGFNDGLSKLGLQLERRKGSVETLIVDRVEKTPTGN